VSQGKTGGTSCARKKSHSELRKVEGSARGTWQRLEADGKDKRESLLRHGEGHRSLSKRREKEDMLRGPQPSFTEIGAKTRMQTKRSLSENRKTGVLKSCRTSKEIVPRT